MRKGERTSRMLLESAAQLIAQNGIDQLTLRSLATHANLSSGLIPRYFPDFSSIFAEVVSYIFEEARAEVRKAPAIETAEQKLNRVATQNFDFFAIRRPHYNKCLILSYTYIGINKSISEKHLEMINGAVEAATRLFKSMAVENGARLTDELAEAYGRAFTQQLEGGLIHCSFLKSKSKRQEFMDRYLRDQEVRLKMMIRSMIN